MYKTTEWEEGSHLIETGNWFTRHMSDMQWQRCPYRELVMTMHKNPVFLSLRSELYALPTKVGKALSIQKTNDR